MLIFHKNNNCPDYELVDNQFYFPGRYTFLHGGVLKIGDVEYTIKDYNDVNKLIEISRAFVNAREQERMWEQLSD